VLIIIVLTLDMTDNISIFMILIWICIYVIYSILIIDITLNNIDIFNF